MKKQIFTTLILIFAATQFAVAGDIIVSTTADSGEGSLRQAILDANQQPGTDNIIFNIPMSDRGFLPAQLAGQSGWAFFIRLEQDLPLITESLIIDGASQTRFTGDTNTDLLGAEVIIVSKNKQAMDANTFTASSDNNIANSTVLRQVELLQIDSQSAYNDIMQARGGKAPMR